MEKRYTTKEIRALKGTKGELFFITAHDADSAQILDNAGVQLILIGDSVANTIFGYDSTVHATVDMILHHTRAVSNNTRRALVVADVPFLKSYSEKILFDTARRFIQEGGAQAIKIEVYSDELLASIKKLTTFGVPVIGHIGLTPQLYYQMGGYSKKGGTQQAHECIISLAKSLEASDVFCLLLECIPEDLAKKITLTVQIPTIGIGSGNKTDGQAHVFHDIVGMSINPPKHAKVMGNARQEMIKAIQKYIDSYR